jgi:hypothetical protein
MFLIDLKRSQLSASERSDLSEDLENEFIDTGKAQYFNTTTSSQREVSRKRIYE